MNQPTKSEEVTSYEELTLDELKAEVEARDLDMPSRPTKKVLIELLEHNDTFVAEHEKVAEAKPSEAISADEVAPVTFDYLKNGVKGDHAPAGSKAAIMKEHLMQQPPVRIIIPMEKGEKSGATFPVQLNGYRLNIQKGVYVDVPQQVAEVVMEHFNQQEQARQIGLAANAGTKEGVSAAQALNL